MPGAYGCCQWPSAGAFQTILITMMITVSRTRVRGMIRTENLAGDDGQMNNMRPGNTERQDRISLWDTSAIENDPYASLQSDITTNIAIVGGGFTGLSTALHARELGLECHVLEGQHIGYGGSGRNVGLVNAGLWLPPQDVRTQLGDARGSGLIDLLGRAPEYVFSLIEKHQIRCEAKRSGTIHAAHSMAGFEDLSRRHAEWQRLEAPVDLLDAKQIAEKIGSKAFYGGLIDRRCGTINPMGYARGLARAAKAAGAEIHTNTRVLSLSRENDKWRLETTGGTVTANAVILGTNAYTDELWPDLNRAFTMIHYFNVPSEPLGKRGSHILPEGQGLWDTGKVMFSVRRDDFGRLILGSMGKVIGGEKGLTEHWANKTAKRLFPELGSINWEKAWHGQIAMTNDHLPRIHRLAPNLYTPIGYNGRGITPGTMFGKAMAELLNGGDEDSLPLPVTDLSPVPFSNLMASVYEAAFKAYRVYKSI